MSLEILKQQTAAYLEITYPTLDDASMIVEECFDNALNSFSESFIGLFHPNAWGKITVIYHKHFLETGVDISIGEIFSVAIRDSINTSRMDFLTQSLAQQRAYEKNHPKDHKADQKTSLKVIKNNRDSE